MDGLAYYFWAAIFLSLIPAYVCHRKGYPFILGYLGSVILSPVIGLVIALVLSPYTSVLEDRALREGMVRCPYCDELIREDAVVCRHCGRDID